MTTLKVRDANGDLYYLLVSGTGNATDPFIPAHTVSAITNRTVLSVTGSVTDLGDNALIAVAPGQSIVLTSFCLQNEGSSPVTAILKDGATAFWRVYCQSQGDGIIKDYPIDARPSLSGALALNLSAAVKVGYSVSYYLV
jgi:hypothetical protein